MKTRIIAVLLIVSVCLILAFGKFVPLSRHAPARNIVWSEDFNAVFNKGTLGIPDNWKLRKKPGTQVAVFSLGKDANSDNAYLHMEADKASGSLITRVDGVDIEKTPFLKWSWRVRTFPDGGDSRYKKKDDQAIGIYVGTGSILSNKCVSYRWDTDTPKGEEGGTVYGGGAVKVKWITLRNKDDASGGEWAREERNAAEDFKKAWGFYPKKVYLSVSCNSQYTGTKASADLGRLEFSGDNGRKDAGIPQTHN